MVNSVVFVAAILAGSWLWWMTFNQARADGQIAYQPVEVRTDDLRRRRKGPR